MAYSLCQAAQVVSWHSSVKLGWEVRGRFQGPSEISDGLLSIRI